MTAANSLAGIIEAGARRILSGGNMDDKTKADIEKLDTLRELALCGPEEGREQAQRAYEELRAQLLGNVPCEVPDDTRETKELTDGR